MPLTSAELINHMQVPGATKDGPPERIFALGLFERRLTLFAQQTRAINLAYSLYEQKMLATNASVAVIGGGVAGVTAAAALVRLGAQVELIERSDGLIPLQDGCRTRWVHPRIYDWPEQGSEENEASLPLMKWSAGYAHDIAAALKQEFNRYESQVRKTFRSRIAFVKGGARPSVGWQGISPAGSKIIEPSKEFDAVVVAVGFGTEDGTADLAMTSYWRNDDFDQPVLRFTEPIEFLVSGNGDGGLIDLLRLRIRQFRLESLHHLLRDTLKAPEFEKLVAQLRQWETEAPRHDDVWLWHRYSKELDVPAHFITYVKQNLLRGDTKVWLASGDAPISLRSAVLNRLWVALLVEHDQSTTWIPSKTLKITDEGQRKRVVFSNHHASNTTLFHHAIVRHGPTSALVGALEWIRDRCTARQSAQALDQTRYPLWGEAAFETSRPVSDAGQTGLLAQVGQDSSVAVDVSGSQGAQVLGPAPARSITFHDHCRVDTTSILAAAKEPLAGAPILQWHGKLVRTRNFITRAAAQLDEVVKTTQWYQRNESQRQIQVPAFKRSFFDNLDGLIKSEEETRAEMSALWSYLAGAEVNARISSLTTFAALAALRLIHRLQRFEWQIQTDDGHRIVNLFPDLPAIKSSWLLRRVPYRSRIGGLALGQERLLLARIGPTDSSYQYFLLPEAAAERLQDDRAGITSDVFNQWIVPQWFFQEYEGLPQREQTVQVLADEFGRERYFATRAAPWSGSEEREEEPHESLATRTEIRELGEGWTVFVLPRYAAGTAGRPAEPPPLTGRTILWVDDNPENNQFEIGLLEALGAKIFRAISTREALSTIDEGRPQLVISDMHRREDGRDRPRAGLTLREKLAGRIPIVFYTGNRSRTPAKVREITADQPSALVALVQAHIREPRPCAPSPV
jgi:CheY-like chemotaxis protein